MNDNPKHIHIRDFQYDLPDERIAKFPLPERDHSKLLLYRTGRSAKTISTTCRTISRQAA